MSHFGYAYSLEFSSFGRKILVLEFLVLTERIKEPNFNLRIKFQIYRLNLISRLAINLTIEFASKVNCKLNDEFMNLSKKNNDLSNTKSHSNS